MNSTNSYFRINNIGVSIVTFVEVFLYAYVYLMVQSSILLILLIILILTNVFLLLIEQYLVKFELFHIYKKILKFHKIILFPLSIFLLFEKSKNILFFGYSEIELRKIYNNSEFIWSKSISIHDILISLKNREIMFNFESSSMQKLDSSFSTLHQVNVRMMMFNITFVIIVFLTIFFAIYNPSYISNIVFSGQIKLFYAFFVFTCIFLAFILFVFYLNLKLLISLKNQDYEQAFIISIYFRYFCDQNTFTPLIKRQEKVLLKELLLSVLADKEN